MDAPATALLPTDCALLPLREGSLLISPGHALFCRVDEVYFNATEVEPGSNADTGEPLDPAPDNPTDLKATDGADALVDISFKFPAAPVQYC